MSANVLDQATALVAKLDELYPVLVDFTQRAHSRGVDWVGDDYEAELSALRFALARFSQDEWVVVPRVPTVEMVVAATEQWLCISAQEDRAEVIWDAMLANVPPDHQP